jgi:lipopolysaccharide export system protein LptC
MPFLRHSVITAYKHCRGYRLFSYACLLCLLACHAEDPAINGELNAALAAPYDYYITDMRSYTYTPSGELQYTLNAERLTHFPNDNHAELLAPTLLWLNAGEAPWILTADTGRIERPSSEQTLWLTHNVSLASTHTAKTPLTMTTEKLQLLPAAKQARTDAAVTVTSFSNTLQSEGMQFDLPNNQLKLLSKVRGIHAP